MAASAIAVVRTGPIVDSAMAAYSFARMLTPALPPSSGYGRVSMILFLLTGNAPFFLLILLAALVYLTWIELRDEPVELNVKLWWLSLVLLTNVPGYVVLRIWLYARRRAQRA
jgi:hypothetical protein